MASAPINQQCDICRKNRVTKDASVWCIACKESLCPDCLQIHRDQDIFKHHKLFPIEDYTLDPTITAIKDRCDQHHIKFDFYCVDHDTPICVKCVQEDHKVRSNVKTLKEVTTNVKESFLLTDLQERASDIQDMVQHIIKDMSKRQAKVGDETSRAISVVKAARKAFNERLDLLQGEIIKKIKRQETDIQDKITRTLTKLHSLHQGAQETLDSLSNAIRCASNFHIYCGIKLWNDNTQQREVELMSLQENLQYFERFDININQKLTNLQTAVTEFASIKSEYTKHEVQLLQKEQQGQKLVRNIDKTLSNARSFTIVTSKKSMYILGCCVMESGSMIFTISDKKALLHINKKGTHYTYIKLSFQPYDIVDVDGETVAVSSHIKTGLCW